MSDRRNFAWQFNVRLSTDFVMFGRPAGHSAVLKLLRLPWRPVGRPAEGSSDRLGHSGGRCCLPLRRRFAAAGGSRSRRVSRGRNRRVRGFRATGQCGDRQAGSPDSPRRVEACRQAEIRWEEMRRSSIWARCSEGLRTDRREERLAPFCFRTSLSEGFTAFAGTGGVAQIRHLPRPPVQVLRSTLVTSMTRKTRRMPRVSCMVLGVDLARIERDRCFYRCFLCLGVSDSGI